MASQQVQLGYAGNVPAVSLRELTGYDEHAVHDTTTRSAVDLLSRVVTL